MSDRYDIRDKKGNLTGTISPKQESIDLSDEGPVGSIGMLLGLAVIGFIGGWLATWWFGGLLIGVILKFSVGSAATAFDKSFALALYGGFVGAAVLCFYYVRDNWKLLLQGVYTVIAFIVIWGFIIWVFTD